MLLQQLTRGSHRVKPVAGGLLDLGCKTLHDQCLARGAHSGCLPRGIEKSAVFCDVILP